MNDSLDTTKARVWAAINLEAPVPVPVAPQIAYFAARHAGITMERYINDYEACMAAQHKLYEDTGGWDIINAPGPYDIEKMIVFSTPMGVQVPGKQLPVDAIPQFVEKEYMPIEEYDLVIQKGWSEYFDQVLQPRIFPEMADPEVKGQAFAQMEVIGAAMFEDVAWYSEHGAMTFGTAFCNPPFDLLAWARSYNHFAIDLYRQPEKILATIEVMLPEITAIALSTAEMSTEPFMFLSPGRSDGRYLSPKQFERFAFPGMMALCEAFIAKDLAIVMHLDANWLPLLPFFREFPQGKYVLQLDSATDILKAKEIIGDRMCIMGDVPATMLKLGTPAEVEKYCQNLIETIGDKGGLIISSGCEVPVDAKFDNVKSMIDTARNYVPSWWK